MTIKEIILDLVGKIDALSDELRRKPVAGFDSELLVGLTRHQLGSISLKDVIDSDMLTGDKKNEYLQQAELIWTNPVFLNELNRIIRLQLEFIGMNADYFEKVILARGTINGADLVKERFEKLHVEYKDINKPQERFDPFAVSV